MCIEPGATFLACPLREKACPERSRRVGISCSAKSKRGDFEKSPRGPNDQHYGSTCPRNPTVREGPPKNSPALPALGQLKLWNSVPKARPNHFSTPGKPNSCREIRPQKGNPCPHSTIRHCRGFSHNVENQALTPHQARHC